jgi:hypothetical protein
MTDVFPQFWTAAFLTLSVLSFVAAGYARALWRRSAGWPAAEGIVTHSAVIRDDDGNLVPNVRYEYVVDSATHSGDRITLGVTFGSTFLSRFATRVTERYPVGKSVTVLYDPDDPSRACLERGRGGTPVLFGAIGLVLFASAFAPALSTTSGSRAAGSSDPQPRSIRDWTRDEIDCAATIGVRIGAVSYRGADARTLAWISDRVVLGTVRKTRTHPREAYHTDAVIDVSETWKGPENGEPIVKLLSGPVYDERLGRTIHGATSHEPRFEVGERVLLFLSRNPIMKPPDDPDRYRLGPSEYTTVPTGKWVMIPDTDRVRAEGDPGEGRLLDRVREDVALAVRTQSAGCPPGN